MSLDTLRSIMSTLNTTTAWMVSLVKIKNTKRNGTTYAVRGISLSPEGALSRFVTNLSNVYTDGNTAFLNKYTSVVDYDGTTEAIKIYKLHSDSEMISGAFTRLIHTISTPATTGDPLEFDANAYALRSTMSIGDEEKNVILFSLQNPICVLKNRFLYDNGSFFELNKRVLNLRQTIDVIIVDNTVYLLSLAGEKLFNMERSYRIICETKSADICASGIITNTELFKSIATGGHNPRRFVSFNQERYDSMKDATVRRAMATTFKLPLDAAGNIDTSSPDAAEKLIKVLCDKGMVDPFKNVPVEVPGASRW